MRKLGSSGVLEGECLLFDPFLPSSSSNVCGNPSIACAVTSTDFRLQRLLQLLSLGTSGHFVRRCGSKGSLSQALSAMRMWRIWQALSVASAVRSTQNYTRDVMAGQVDCVAGDQCIEAAIQLLEQTKGHSMCNCLGEVPQIVHPGGEYSEMCENIPSFSGRHDPCKELGKWMWESSKQGKIKSYKTKEAPGLGTCCARRKNGQHWCEFRRTTPREARNVCKRH